MKLGCCWRFWRRLSWRRSLWRAELCFPFWNRIACMEMNASAPYFPVFLIKCWFPFQRCWLDGFKMEVSMMHLENSSLHVLLLAWIWIGKGMLLGCGTSCLLWGPMNCLLSFQKPWLSAPWWPVRLVSSFKPTLRTCLIIYVTLEVPMFIKWMQTTLKWTILLPRLLASWRPWKRTWPRLTGWLVSKLKQFWWMIVVCWIS